MTAGILGELRAAGIDVFEPGDDAYRNATSPENSIATQKPFAVTRPTTTHQVETIVHAAHEAAVPVSVQATGHGAARTLGDETLLIDMSGLATVRIEPESRLAIVGAGATWGAVQAAAEQHGLLGLAGTSPLVGVAGYTFGGGVGWLTRPHGLAAAALRSVDLVDGTGRSRAASDDASDAIDRAAIIAFRGGAPVGIATTLTFDLFLALELYAGYLLWPLREAPAVVATWAAILDTLPASLTSTMAFLSLPPDGPFPADLRGTTVVHLSFATVGGEKTARSLLDPVRRAATPAVDTSGPCDVDRLAQIHLDPPPGEASIGDGRWLNAKAGTKALAILESASVGEEGGLTMMELRHVASAAGSRKGTLTSVPGPLLYQGIGPAGDDNQGSSSRSALRRVATATQEFDVGRAFEPFRTGQTDPADAYSAHDAAALSTLNRRTDPAGVFRFERVPETTA